MPPNNTPNVAQQSNGRKPTARVVPVVPLALGRPRPTKPSRRVEEDAQAGAEASPAAAEPVHVRDQPQEPAQLVVNGDDGYQADTTTLPDGRVMDTGVTMPVVDTPPSRGSAAMSLSFGGTPELQTAESSQPATPPPNQSHSPVSAASLASSRKPNDRFDMRQIRTELPPAFVPSAEQHTPQSATSSHSTRPSNSRPPIHPSHPSTSSIVFGGQDSSASSPAPPPSTGSAFTSPPYPAFGAQHQPYFNPHGHAHHNSEPAFRHHQNAYSYGQSAPGWQHRHGYAQPISHTPSFHPQAHMPFRYPPRDGFAAGAPSPRVNGHASSSRSPSQASSATREQRRPSRTESFPLSPATPADNVRMTLPPNEPRVGLQGQHHPRQQGYQLQMPPPPPPPPTQPPDLAASSANAEALREHMLMILSTSEFADCQLVITDDFEPERSLKCHQSILARSPALLDLLKSTESSGNSIKVVPIQLRGPYLRSGTLIDCIRYLYGERLLRYDFLRANSATGEHLPSNLERMGKALQTIATGAWLKVAPIAIRGTEVASSVLHWETISLALAFALEGGLSPVWNADDGSEDRASVSSSDESVSRAELVSSPTYEPYSTHLLTRIVEFMIHFFPISFYLDAAAPQLTACPRLPTFPSKHESRSSRSDPRLSQIRFGDIPSEELQRPSLVTTTVSSILLSVPFQVLKYVLESAELSARLGQETVASIMRQVVAERETRRSKVLKSATPALINHTSDSQIVHNLYWEESVETSTRHGAGFRLVRRKRDIDTPPSSGACSERNK